MAGMPHEAMDELARLGDQGKDADLFARRYCASAKIS